MRHRLLLTAITGSIVASSANAQHPADFFWINGEVVQGMTKAEFDAYTSANGIEVSNPLPTDDKVLGANVDGTSYWFVFCNDELTYASWMLASNDHFTKSIATNVGLGFTMSDYSATSYFNDRVNKDISSLSFSFTHPEKRYSIKYDLFSENGQITLEDVRYDQSIGCAGDR